MSRQLSPEQIKHIEQTYDLLINTLRLNQIPLEVAASALMIATCRLSVHSIETDENIQDQFRKALAMARMSKTQKTEGAA